MPKIQVESKLLYVGSEQYPKGSVVEMTEEDAKVTVAQGNAKLVDPKTPVTEGVPVAIDSMERALREGKYKEVEGQITPPPASQDPKKPIAAERIPSDAVVQPLGKS